MLRALASKQLLSTQTMRINLPSTLLLAGIASTSVAWAPVALGNNPRSSPSVGAPVGVSWPTSSAICRSSIHSTSSALHALMPPLSSQYEEHIPLARDAMKFIDDSPDPFHAVKTSAEALESIGFVEWKDDGSADDSALSPGGKYYFTRNKSTLVAFTVGANYQPGNGFKIIGSHTDSPNLKVKPYSKRTTAKGGGPSGAIQLAVECYGGGLWHTWFDRDLGVSGRVFLRDRESGKIRQVRKIDIYIVFVFSGTNVFI